MKFLGSCFLMVAVMLWVFDYIAVINFSVLPAPLCHGYHKFLDNPVPWLLGIGACILAVRHILDKVYSGEI